MNNIKKRVGVLISIVMMMSILCVAMIACAPSGVIVTYVSDGREDVVESRIDEFALPTPPTKEGHNFIGWFFDKDVWTVPFKADYFDVTEDFETIITVYAHYSVITGIDKPTATGVLTYNNTMQLANIPISELYTIKGTTKATEAGTYVATLSLIDTVNTSWTGGSTDDINVEWKIAQKLIDMPTITSKHVYSGIEQEVEILTSDDYSIAGKTKATDAGVYSITVSLVDDKNTVWKDGKNADLTVDWKIEKKEITTPQYKKVMLYDETEKTVEISESADYVISGKLSETKVGKYAFYLNLSDEANTKWKDTDSAQLTCDWSIIADGVVKPAKPQDKIFQIKPQIVDIPESDSYIISGDKYATVAGTYNVTVSLKSDHAAWFDGSTDDLSYSWKILKNEIIVPKIRIMTYSGEAQRVLRDTIYYDTNGVTSATVAGDYKMTLQLKYPDSTFWANSDNLDINVDWTMLKRKINKPTVESIYIYSGDLITADIAKDKFYVVGGVFESVSAGHHMAVLTLTETVNVSWADGSIAPINVDWMIAAKEIKVPTTSGNVTYNGAEQENNIIKSDDYTLSGVTQATDAGFYKVVVSLKSDSNFCWVNYNDVSDKVIMWELRKSEILKPKPINPIEYHGKLIAAPFSGSGYEVTGDQATEAGTYTATFSLLDKLNHIWNDATTENFDIEWVIETLKVNKPSDPPRFSFDYTGDEYELLFHPRPSYTISGNRGTEVGNYTATISLINKKSTVWIDNPNHTEDLTFDWTITRAVVNKPADVNTFYTASEQTLTSNNPSAYTISGNIKATEIGTYSITAKLVNDKNYMWAGGSTSDVQFNWKIQMDKLTYEFVHGSKTEVKIMKYEGNSETVAIPDTIDGKIVTEIYNYAFFENKTLKHIIIPETITAINQFVFKDCTSLETVTFLGNSKLKLIGKAAFSGTTMLKTFSLPASVTELIAGAFSGSGLETFHIPANSKLITIGESTFNGCANLGYVIIPATVTNIGTRAFFACPKITVFANVASKPADWVEDWNLHDMTTNKTYITPYWSGQWELVGGVPTPNKK